MMKEVVWHRCTPLISVILRFSIVMRGVGRDASSSVTDKDGVIDLRAANFVEHAGNFDQHPVAGHKYAMVAFCSRHSDQCLPFKSVYRQVARAVRAHSLASHVLVGIVNVDDEENQELVKNFELKEYPALLWLTKGQQNWQSSKKRTVKGILSRVGAELGKEIAAVPDSDGIFDLHADNFVEHAGNFGLHPSVGHKYAMVKFCWSHSDHCRAFNSVYNQVARAVRANSLESGLSDVLVARVNVDYEGNEELVKNFQLKEYPALLWLTRGEQNWQLSKKRTVKGILSRVGAEVGRKISAVPDSDGVFDLHADNFVEHAGNFDRHPVVGHKYAMAAFCSRHSQQCRAFSSTYKQVARAVRANSLESDVLVARVNVDYEENEELVKNFQLKEYPSLLWFTKGEQNWQTSNERTVKGILSRVGAALGKNVKVEL